jgi:hypothetical protein
MRLDRSKGGEATGLPVDFVATPSGLRDLARCLDRLADALRPIGDS